MDRLSPLDSSFLHVENDVNHMHIASVALFEGPAPAYGDLVRMVAGKLLRVPRYRHRVCFVPFELGRPVWVDDPHFRLEYHLRHTALPAPGGVEELRNLVGRVMAQPLDRSKPLWEMWVVEGVEGGRWALLSKVHHCMVDGIAGTDLLTVVLDDRPDATPVPPDVWRPQESPSGLRLVAEALSGLVLNPYEQIRAARSALLRPQRVMARLTEAGKGFQSLAGLLRATPESSLFGPIGPHRRWAWARSTLAEVKTIRSAFGGTVNDVVLAAVTRGFRDLLEAHGDRVEGRVVRTLVPVSVRRPDERGVYNNRVSAMFAELPVGIADPIERLASIRKQMQGLKESKQAVAAGVLTSLSGFAPELLLALGMRVATRVAHRFGPRNVNTVTTNVPGPQRPLYALGRRMLEVFPYVPIASPSRVGVAIFSYDGKISFAATADYDTVPDVALLCAGIEAELAELVKAAERPPAAASGEAAAG